MIPVKPSPSADLLLNPSVVSLNIWVSQLLQEKGETVAAETNDKFLDGIGSRHGEPLSAMT
jgi:hypothetical protein